MIYKINDEQIFQVLSSSFTIGPSETGYELQVGATSRDFSTLFSVGANTPRMVTNVANGSYFRLLNNVGEVEVNWSRTCKDGGDGGSFDPSVLDPYWTSAQTKDYVDEALSGISLDGYYTSAQTDEKIASAITAVEDHLFDVEQVTASALTELHDGLMEVSGRTVDLSGYYTSGQTDAAISAATSLYTPTSGFSTINGSAITEGGNLVIQGGGDTQELQDQIDTLDEVVSAALVDLEGKKVESQDVKHIVKLTQAQYDQLATKDPYTFYIIVSN